MNFSFLSKSIVFALGLILVSCEPPLKVTNLKITSPVNDSRIDKNPMKVIGIVESNKQDEFLSIYTICLYKDIDDSLYWQKNNGNVIISGTNWQGEIWLQKDDFTQTEIKDGYKTEGVLAVVCQKNQKLPGDGMAETGIPIQEVEQALPQNIGINKSLPNSYLNMYPSKQ